MGLKRHISPATAALAVATIAGLSRTATASAGSWAIPSALVISKSSNKNEVHYAVQVDESCAPAGPRPVSPYWLMLERGPNVTEPLHGREQGILGVDQQQVTDEGILMTLRGFPDRPLMVRTWRGADGQCASGVDMRVAGVPARVASVYVKQKFLGVDYVLLTGVAAGGAVVSERITM